MITVLHKPEDYILSFDTPICGVDSNCCFRDYTFDNKASIKSYVLPILEEQNDKKIIQTDEDAISSIFYLLEEFYSNITEFRVYDHGFCFSDPKDPTNIDICVNLGNQKNILSITRSSHFSFGRKVNLSELKTILK